MPGFHAEILRQLICNIATRNCEASYKKLFGLLFNSLFRFSNCMLNSREAAEEVASDVLFRIWEKRAEMKQVANVEVYAFIIARNLSLNQLKKMSASRMVSFEDIKTELDAETLNPEQVLINVQDKARLEKCVEALPTRCKLVFKLIREEGLSYNKVAEVLSISPKTVDAHLVTAMKKLADALKTSSRYAKN